MQDFVFQVFSAHSAISAVKCLWSEVKHQTAANIVIMLAALAGIYIDRRHSTPVVTHLKPEPGSMQAREPDIHSHSALQDAGGLAPWPCVRATEKQVAARSEAAHAPAEAEPSRNRQV